jgi:hypothetical protein
LVFQLRPKAAIADFGLPRTAPHRGAQKLPKAPKKMKISNVSSASSAKAASNLGPMLRDSYCKAMKIIKPFNFPPKEPSGKVFPPKISATLI